MTDFDALYAAHRDDVWRYFRRRTASDHEDLVTEVFLVAWRRRDDVPTAEPLPWLYGVARRVLANHRSAGDRRDALTERAAVHAATTTPDLADTVGLRTDLARALDTLSDRDRELVLLVAWEGLTLAEAAAALGCRRGAAAVRLHRARRRLHTALHAGSGTALASMTALEER